MIARITGTVTVVGNDSDISNSDSESDSSTSGVVLRAQKVLVARLMRVASRTKNEKKSDGSKILILALNYLTEFVQIS